MHVRKLAEELARTRKERLTSAHLLAALASEQGAVQSLLLDRRLSAEILLKAARATTDEEPEPVRRAVERAHRVADHMRSAKPNALHLLLALVQDRRSGAYKALEQCGVEVSRLRLAATQLVLEIVGPRRLSRPEPIAQNQTAKAPAPPPRPLPSSRSASAPRGTAVSLLDLSTHVAATSARQRADSPSVSSPPPPMVSSGPAPGVGRSTTPRPPEVADKANARALPDARDRDAASVSPPPAAQSHLPTQERGRPNRPSESASHAAPSASHAAPSASHAAPSASHAAPSASHAAPSAPPGPRRRPGRGDSGALVPERFALDAKRFSMLSSLGRNLTTAAARGELEAVIGREREIEQALDVLAKRRANNPLLVGGPGVGKTSVARGIALRMAAQKSAGTLDDRVLVEIPIGDLLAGSGTRGALAERIATLRTEVRESKGRIVLFFDEIHALFAGDAEEAAAELKSALARGEFPCIGTTTPEECRRTIEADGALARRFTQVNVDEPDADTTTEILRGSTPSLARHHTVEYENEAVERAVEWSVRYLSGRMLPDKALSALDLAGARARRRSADRVTAECVAEVVSELAFVPIERLLETDRQRMMQLESLLARKVVGHTSALARMAAILKRNAAGFRGRRPIGTFLLLGPTGVGKTESAKAIADALFHSPDSMTRLDMAEFAESHAIARLVGAPPGYVGHDAGGQLTEAVRRRPYQVILLDEIEKAHRDVLEAFLSVFDEGRLTDGRGKTVDFTNTVILMTSNLGAERVSRKPSRGIGFSDRTGAAAGQAADVEAELVAAARAALPPELYNRIDEVIAFTPLERNEVAEIARRLLAGIAGALLQAQGIHLDVDDDAIEALLAAGGYDPQLGARPMKRTLARLVEAPIAERLLSGTLVRGDVARVTRDGEQVVVDVVKKSASSRVA